MDLDPSALFASLVVSTIGLAFFVYGKKQSRFALLVAGLLMMAVPYALTTTLTIVLFGAAAIAGGLVVDRRRA